jgi:cell filamentation protein
MSRYGAPAGGDEFEPGSRCNVLRNRMGITRIVDAARVESELLAVAYVDSLSWVDTTTRFSARLVTEMHRLWLGDLYPVAGTYRTVDLAKNGFTFCHALYVPEQMVRFEREQLEGCTPCTGDLSDVAEKVARVHAELVLIHPFREGNGRLARWIADLMTMQAGLPPPQYDLKLKESKLTYYAALRKGFYGELKDLQALFVAWIESALK